MVLGPGFSSFALRLPLWRIVAVILVLLSAVMTQEDSWVRHINAGGLAGAFAILGIVVLVLNSVRGRPQQPSPESSAGGTQTGSDDERTPESSTSALASNTNVPSIVPSAAPELDEDEHNAAATRQRTADLASGAAERIRRLGVEWNERPDLPIDLMMVLGALTIAGPEKVIGAHLALASNQPDRDDQIGLGVIALRGAIECGAHGGDAQARLHAVNHALIHESSARDDSSIGTTSLAGEIVIAPPATDSVERSSEALLETVRVATTIGGPSSSANQLNEHDVLAARCVVASSSAELGLRGDVPLLLDWSKRAALEGRPAAAVDEVLLAIGEAATHMRAMVDELGSIRSSYAEVLAGEPTSRAIEIVDMICANPVVTVKDVQRATGLSHQGVRNHISRFVQRGWLVDVGPPGRGCPSRWVAFPLVESLMQVLLS